MALLLDSIAYGSNVNVTEDAIYAKYEYDRTEIVKKTKANLASNEKTVVEGHNDASGDVYVAQRVTDGYEFKTERLPEGHKMGMMLVSLLNVHGFVMLTLLRD